MKIYGLPQPLTGSETVTIHQNQGNYGAKCTLPISELLNFFQSQYTANLPTTKPSTAGVMWNNSGVVSIS